MKYNFLGVKENMEFFTDFTGGIYGTISGLQGVILHDAGSGMSATARSVAQYTFNNMKQDSGASNYHNVVDDKGNCYAVVGEKYASYSLGDKNQTDTYYPNDHFISIEIAPSLTGGDFANQGERDKYKKAWLNGCKMVADYCVKYGLTSDQVHQHREYGSTSCPYTMEKYFGSYEKALSETRAQVKKEIANIKGGSTNDQGNANVEQPKKSNSQIADEVIAGKWGNGTDRKKNLEKAGYDYDAVQKEVNKKLGTTSEPKKSNSQIADEVIAGKWGNMPERKTRLEKAGYDYNAVQKEVNKKLS